MYESAHFTFNPLPNATTPPLASVRQQRSFCVVRFVLAFLFAQHPDLSIRWRPRMADLKQTVTGLVEEGGGGGAVTLALLTSAIIWSK